MSVFKVIFRRFLNCCCYTVYYPRRDKILNVAKTFYSQTFSAGVEQLPLWPATSPSRMFLISLSSLREEGITNNDIKNDLFYIPDNFAHRRCQILQRRSLGGGKCQHFQQLCHPVLRRKEGNQSEPEIEEASPFTKMIPDLRWQRRTARAKGKSWWWSPTTILGPRCSRPPSPPKMPRRRRNLPPR